MQLYAKIKRTSEYTHQCDGKHFPVELQEPDFDWNEYDYLVIGGIGGRYKLEDVNLFLKTPAGKFIRLHQKPLDWSKSA